MALPLTTEQQADVDLLLSEFQDWRSALMNAIRADNDPAHNLGDARARKLALSSASGRLYNVLVSRGGLSGGGEFGHPTEGRAIIPREPPIRGFIQPTDTPSVTQ